MSLKVRLATGLRWGADEVTFKDLIAPIMYGDDISQRV